MRTSLIIFFLFSCLHLSAQNRYAIGLVAIGQQTFMNNKDDKKDNSFFNSEKTYGAAGGINFLYRHNSNVAISGSLLFSQLHQKFTSYNPYMNSHSSGNKRNAYLKLPLTLELETKKFKKISFYINGGPQLSILLIADGPVVPYFDSTALGGTTYFDLVQAERKFFKPLLFDVTLGAGLNFYLSEKYFLKIGYRFDYSFTDSERKDAQYTRSDNSVSSVYHQSNPNRPHTHNITEGILFGIYRTF